MLYPLRFRTIFKDKIWGGSKIKTVLGKDYTPLPNCGETWELSGVKDNLSVVENGSLAGEDLQALVSEYKELLVGKKNYERFGDEFPLLIKFIDANDDLSIQVHPDDALAKERHNGKGKTEMWYILAADEAARLNTGFKKETNKEEYLEYLNKGKIQDLLNYEEVYAGDVFYLPAGRVHYIGRGILLAEIQQTSDTTYRIYDFDRKDEKGNKRELHTDLALDAIDFKHYPDYKIRYEAQENMPVTLVESPYFTTDLFDLTDEIELDYSETDTFRIFIVVEGDVMLTTGGSTSELMTFGDVILIPASVKDVLLSPLGEVKLLEVYIP
ncbi:MAG: class I mannose-6-phosphate isomerase [Cytophagales bacterium]|nr:class I mannose-6-phosphate isomerase [Cytophaga sp.]